MNVSSCLLRSGVTHKCSHQSESRCHASITRRIPTPPWLVLWNHHGFAMLCYGVKPQWCNKEENNNAKSHTLVVPKKKRRHLFCSLSVSFDTPVITKGPLSEMFSLNRSWTGHQCSCYQKRAAVSTAQRGVRPLAPDFKYRLYRFRLFPARFLQRRINKY